MGKREAFSSVDERNGTDAGRVEGGEEVNEEGDERDAYGVAFIDEEAKSCCHKTPGHVWKGEEEKVSAAEGVDL
jgi:hypothetical protein